MSKLKKVDLDELYGGYWAYSNDSELECDHDILEIKPLREHLEEWIKNDRGFECIRENKEFIENVLNKKQFILLLKRTRNG